MKSRIYRGFVRHARVEPVPHGFRYPLYFYGLDVDELPELARRIPWFGYNRRRLVAIHDRDYLDRSPGTIRDKLLRFLRAQGLHEDVAGIYLVTSARYFNYVFNPVSFYYCYGADGTLRCTVAEVNNTFGERHLYVLPMGGAGHAAAQGSAPKAFHVSPFNDMEGDYTFSFSAPSPQLDVRVDLLKQGRVVFRSQLAGDALPFTARNLAATLARYPFAAALTFPRIVAQAARLYFRRRLGVFRKPPPSSALTIRTAPPTILQRASLKLLTPVLARLRRGTLRLELPGGETRTFGGAEPGAEVAIAVRDHAVFTRLLRDGDIGLGESYTRGAWETPDLTAVIRFFIENRDRLDGGDVGSAIVGRALNRLLHAARGNTTRGSRRNIAAHYDLSNEFFRLWLDPTMLYSCAVYRDPRETLEEAQRNKLDAILRLARIGAGHRVLEIGSGWGAFAIEAARRTGCHVTSVTVSAQQLELARQRARDAGVADRVDFRLCDYRQIEGRFDRIVSIEMLEAVGHRHLGAYFAACERALEPDGRAVLQVITIPDQRYEAYRRSVDWIQKHIFPGGHLPSLTAIGNAMTRNSNLNIESVDSIGPHYARTLRAWRERFLAAVPQVKALGFDDVFIRKWTYYLCYCEAAFATRALNTLHLVLARPGRGAPGAGP